MKSTQLVVLSILIVTATATLRGNLNLIPSQGFISGLSIGLKLRVSSDTIGLIDEDALSKRDLDAAIDTISNPYNRIGGVQNFFNTLQAFSENVNQNVYSEYAFSYILTTTLNQLKDPIEFEYAVNVYHQKTGIDIYRFIDFAEAFKLQGDYLSAGSNFGTAIYLLGSVELADDTQALFKAYEASAGKSIPLDGLSLSLIHISEPTRLLSISYAVFCLKKKRIKEIDIN
eukprot:TRINITY_DN7825_c0_g1_i3.p1 TRINITY_DN7825_c0_g1~~TRINITY_DN7825_c0_g1_i3.p1  ORF type:complete len:229 (+),score=38.34 TRINITY_DN7825_c0_g1_i3:164-850(+)